MIGTIFYPLSRIITALVVFFSSLFAGGGVVTPFNRPAPSLEPPAWPIWAHEHWVWENESTQASATKLVDDYLAHDIRVGANIIDRPWATDATTYIPDPERFPDMQGYIDNLHSKDVRVLLWASSFVNEGNPTFDEGQEKGYFLTGGRVVKWWGGRGAMLDYTNPEAVEWWHKQMDIVLDMGIDGWKVDGSDPYIMLLPGWGKGGYVGWGAYKEQTYGDYYHYTMEKLNNDAVISARPINDITGIGLPLKFMNREINFAGWVGDQDNDWGGMRAALNNMFTSSLYNYVSYGSDIGGFRGSNSVGSDRQKDTFLRWAQLGAFCPIMENGGGGGAHEPWKFDEETVDIYRDFVNLHYELIPYIYSQAAYSFETNQPTMRPQTGIYEYKLGDEIFVAPFYKEGTQRSIAFPQGEWIYMFDESKTYGGGVKTVDVPLNEFPAFIRKGAIFPMADLESDWTVVRVYPTKGENKFGLYEEGKKGSMLSYSMSNDAKSLALRSTETDRSLLFRVAGVTAPTSVGANLAKADSLAQLKTMTTGYFIDADGALWIAAKNAAAGVDVSVLW